jgi:protein ImuA
MLEQLRQRLQTLQRSAGIEGDHGALPLGVAAIDAALGGGLARGALHEIAAPSEAHLAAATGFVLGLVSLPSPRLRGEGGEQRSCEPGEGAFQQTQNRGHAPSPARLRYASAGDLSPHAGRGKNLLWIAEDMALSESGAPYGPGLDAFGLAPERLLTVAAARPRDLLWAMEEALRCRAVRAVIGEVRHGEIDMVAMRRLSLAAAESGALALLLRGAPATDASTAATRWVVGAAATTNVIPGREQSERTRNPETNSEDASGFRVRAFGASRNDEEKTFGPGAPRFAARLIRNRRGPLGSWILQWSDSDERFLLATHAQPVAAPALDRPHRQVA